MGISIALTATSMIGAALLPETASQGQRELQRYFDVTAESSLPAWWMTSLLLAAALAHASAGFITRLGRLRGAWCWVLGAAGFAVLSANEHALLAQRLETLGAALAAVTGFPRPVLAAAVAAGLLMATALALLAYRERRRTRWLLAAGAILLAGSTAAGALTQNLVAGGATGFAGAGSVLADNAGWLGRAAGALLLAAAAMSTMSVTRSREGVRVCHRRAGPRAIVTASVPAADPREEGVPA
ncbi:MAG: hypothetical protein GEU83_04360 [Pseudonocardiaceae bacterium]|nr:hypothetical protein [Pseudonocardiaceae bacterium]